MDILYTTTLPNGLTLRVENCSCRYFGDYHHVRLDVITEIPVPESSELRKVLGPTVTYRRRLSKMAVPSCEVPNALDQLLINFRKTSMHYMADSSFAEKYLRSHAGRVCARFSGLSTKRTI